MLKVGESGKMSSFLESRLVIINTENGSDGIIFLPTKLTIEVGSDLSCDIRIKHDEVEPKHFEIYMDEDFGKVKKKNSRQFCIIFLLFDIVVAFLRSK